MAPGSVLCEILRLLRDHRLEKGHILLHAAQRLRRGVKLGCERLKRVHIARFLLGEPAEILLLESCELGILIVKLRLCVGELLLQKVSRALGGLLARIQILADKE